MSPRCQEFPEIRYALVALPLQVEGLWQRSTFEHEVATANRNYRMKSRQAAGLT